MHCILYLKVAFLHQEKLIHVTSGPSDKINCVGWCTTYNSMPFSGRIFKFLKYTLKFLKSAQSKKGGRGGGGGSKLHDKDSGKQVL